MARGARFSYARLLRECTTSYRAFLAIMLARDLNEAHTHAQERVRTLEPICSPSVLEDPPRTRKKR